MHLLQVCYGHADDGETYLHKKADNDPHLDTAHTQRDSVAATNRHLGGVVLMIPLALRLRGESGGQAAERR